MNRMQGPVLLAAMLVLVTGGGARAGQAADEQAVRAANDAFYAAITAHDPARLAAVWAHADYVRAIHPPDRQPDAGWEAVQASFDRLFASWSDIVAGMPEPSLRVGTDMAWVTGEELFQARRPSGEDVSTMLLGTSVFEKVDGTWLMVHHHVSVPPRPPR